MAAERAGWVLDTSSYTHLCRAGHETIIEKLAPGGIVLVPQAVSKEIDGGRDLYPSIPSVGSVSWASVAVSTDEETFTELEIKAQLGGPPNKNLGECAVIACALHRKMVAILDDRAAITQAKLRGVSTRDTLWIVIEAYKALYKHDRSIVEGIVDDLLKTGMYLPLNSGRSLIACAYERGWLP